MLIEITGKNLDQSVIYFRKRIESELKKTGPRTLSFPGGENGEGINYEIQTKYGLLSVIVVADSINLTKYMHFITLDQENPAASSDIEINIPKVNDSRAVSLFSEEQGYRYICNRGKCTVYKSGIKMSVVLDYFALNHKNVVDIQENDKNSSVIRIAELESLLLFEQIAQFTSQMKRLKQQFRKD